MITDYWAVLGDSERDQWRYVSLQAVGPLDFGMSREDAVATMARQGFTAELHDMGGWGHRTGRTQWRVEFSKPQTFWRQAAVKCYFIDGAGLTCVLVDGRLGPQVTHEGIRLIGRVPSELLKDMEAYADRHGVGLRSCPGGDLRVEDFALELGAQRAGDTVVSWALFCNPGEIAGTSWDIAPAEVWHHW
ncbi:hypothetical protein M8Z33_00485 [Streptomyces sp. ZAF1911]|uniref:hypothetical protein n=1 Tax=Streptomyces sp. ZAF1911 TaxID=2944129 RepID=UPI00237B0AB0|nr:hypothetical protein [Streptomyces sp. ZAF1911]MDD9375167.1 hypothetical protein [Streptomyces sp. ZAF1911]